MVGKRRVPRLVRILIGILSIVAVFALGIELVKLSSKQIMSSDTVFFEQAEDKVASLKVYLEDTFAIEFQENKNVISQFIQSDNLGNTVGFLRTFLTSILMTLFFVVLLLAESINMHKVLNNTILKRKHASIKAFMKIEKI